MNARGHQDPLPTIKHPLNYASSVDGEAMDSDMTLLQAANDNSRHPDLAHLIPSLAWFYGALDHADEPLGTGIDVEVDEMPARVLDVNPEPPTAEEVLRAHEAGAIRVAETSRRVLQFVRVNGEMEPRVYIVPARAVTHIWGAPVTQDKGRIRPSEAKTAVARRQASVDWFCLKLKAIPPGRPKRLFKRRKVLPPVNWADFTHLRGNVPLDTARAACGLPPIDRCPLPGLPFSPDPARLFPGLTAGKGARLDGMKTESKTYRPDPDNYAGDVQRIDRIALEQFEAAQPGSYATLLTAATAGSMSDLVASNDNKTGKRQFVRAAEALQQFLAA